MSHDDTAEFLDQVEADEFIVLACLVEEPVAPNWRRINNRHVNYYIQIYRVPLNALPPDARYYFYDPFEDLDYYQSGMLCEKHPEHASDAPPGRISSGRRSHYEWG